MSHFYNELLKSENVMEKSASSKSAVDIRKELEDIGVTNQTMQVIAGEILGIFEKKAEIPTAPVEDVVETPVEPPVAAPAAPADPAVEAAAAVSADDQLREDATAAAVESAKASITDAASAISTLEQITQEDTAPPAEVPAEPPIETPVAPPATESAATTSDDNQVVAAEEDEGAEKKEDHEEETPAEEKKEEKSEDEDEDEEKEAAMREFERIMKEGTPQEKEAMIDAAYDAALVKMAHAGMTFEDYVLGRVGDEKLASVIIDQSIKLSTLSDQNYLKVADDIMYQMEKSASEF